MSFAAKSKAPPLYPNETPELRQLINEYADQYEVPRPLVHKVVIRESTHQPEARNGPYYGLMQILPATARGMGFHGKNSDLLDAETNLKYAVKYLRGAWILSDGSYDTAVKWYSRGYYYEAKRQGMLEETGLR
jgi:soluble lytic murein transglycosylase-like protein